MFTFFTAVGIALVLTIAEVFFKGPPVINNLFDRAERLRNRSPGRAYLAMLVTYPLAIAVGLYGLATILGVFVGFAHAWYDVGTACVIVFLMGIVGSFFSFLGDVGSLGRSMATGKPRGNARPDVRILTTICFVTGAYGGLICALLKMNGVLDAAL